MGDIYDQNVLQSLDSEINFTYQSIANYIQKFLNRRDADTINAIPQYISLAENRLALDLKIISGVNINGFTIPKTTDPNDPPFSLVLQKPYGWRTTKSIAFVTPRGRSYIYPRSVEYIQTYLNDLSNVDIVDFNYDGLVFYSDLDQSNWLIGPINRSADADLEVMYYSEILPLSSTNPTNYWTQFAPRALIYGALVEGSAFLRSDQRVQEWEMTYQNTIAQLTQENTNRFNDNIIVRKN